MEWQVLFALALAGAAVAVAVSMYATQLGDKLGLMDRPDGLTKLHPKSTAMVGGVALFAAMILGQIGILAVSDGIQFVPQIIPIIAGMFFILGFVDDHRQIGPWLRLLVGAALLISILVMIPELSIKVLQFGSLDTTVDLEKMAVPFTVFCMLCLKHSVNMSDGINGLFIGMCIVWFILLYPFVSPDSQMILSSLAGALLVLLVANLQGRLFMGSSGSYMMPVLIGFLAIDAYNTDCCGGITADYVAICFLIPVLDMGRLIVTRRLRGVSPFAPGRDHLHHILLSITRRPSLVLMVYWTLVGLPALNLYAGVPILYILLVQILAYSLLLFLGRRRGGIQEPAS